MLMTLLLAMNPFRRIPGAVKRAHDRGRLVFFAAGAALALAGGFGQSSAHAFSFSDVAWRAQKMAATPYKAQPSNLPKALRDLSYQQYREIRLKPQYTYWRGAKLPFELGFFHEGSYYDHPVHINEVDDGRVLPIRFNPDMFDYGPNKLDPKQMSKLGFAGFRVHYALNTPKYKDEVLVFLGASYFRAVGKGQVYGLSARGLAIDTALSSGEEFPRFVDFWIVRPAPGAKELTIYALLDSPSVTGAYRFILRPGTHTEMDVKARIFMRGNVSKLGIAPLTSMYLYGENQPAAVPSIRPEVHDSDGLSIHSGTGEWIWRPLVNPKRLLVSSYALTNPAGFGLMQRDRHFSSYEDLDNRYDLRPSAWVEPRGKWGAGRVELVQIPTPDETNDNIVAYWVPDKSPHPKQPYDFEYRLLWGKDDAERPQTSWVMQTRRAQGTQGKPDGSILFALDFEGPALKKLPADAKVEGNVSADGNGKILEASTQHNDVTGGWRLLLRMRRLDNEKPVELRAYLHSANTTLSETWSYLLPPE